MEQIRVFASSCFLLSLNTWLPKPIETFWKKCGGKKRIHDGGRLRNALQALILRDAEGNCCLWINYTNKWPLNLCALSFIYHSPYNDDTLRDVFPEWVSFQAHEAKGNVQLTWWGLPQEWQDEGNGPQRCFLWELWDPGLWQVAEWRNSSRYRMPLVCLWAFGPLSLGLFSDLWVSPVSDLWVSPPRNKAGLPNFGSCWQRFKQRAICGGCLGPQNLATSKNDPSGLYNTFWTTTDTVVKVDGSTLKRWRFVGGHDKSRLMGVASHLVSRWYNWFSNYVRCLDLDLDGMFISCW